MIIVKLDFLTPPTLAEHSQPRFRPVAIVDRPAPAPSQLASLMKISDQLAVLNSTRYAEWAPPFTPLNAKQAALAFNGDVYDGLDAPSLSPADLRFAQAHLRILSGLDRFSEDLDFSLMAPDPAFRIDRYASQLEEEIAAFGFRVRAERIEKSATTAVESAFLKVDTIRELLVIEAGREIVREIPKGKVLKIKLEVDTGPPAGLVARVAPAITEGPAGAGVSGAGAGHHAAVRVGHA
jgi:hypothetical protein